MWIVRSPTKTDSDFFETIYSTTSQVPEWAIGKIDLEHMDDLPAETEKIWYISRYKILTTIDEWNFYPIWIGPDQRFTSLWLGSMIELVVNMHLADIYGEDTVVDYETVLLDDRIDQLEKQGRPLSWETLGESIRSLVRYLTSKDENFRVEALLV